MSNKKCSVAFFSTKRVDRRSAFAAVSSKLPRSHYNSTLHLSKALVLLLLLLLLSFLILWEENGTKVLGAAWQPHRAGCQRETPRRGTVNSQIASRRWDPGARVRVEGGKEEKGPSSSHSWRLDLTRREQIALHTLSLLPMAFPFLFKSRWWNTKWLYPFMDLYESPTSRRPWRTNRSRAGGARQFGVSGRGYQLIQFHL